MESERHDRDVFTLAAMRLRQYVVVVLLMTLAVGCERAPQPDRQNDGVDASRGESQPEMLFFPDALHVSEASVNDFVTRAMTVCGSGDYEAFRLLWATNEEPLARGDYEQGWQAVEEIRIQAVEKVQYLPTGDAKGAVDPVTGYLIAADVRLDPLQPTGKRGAGRDVVLLMVHEGDTWRLAAAPQLMRNWIQAELLKRGNDNKNMALPDETVENRSGT